MKTHSMPVLTSADSKASTDSVSTVSTAGPTMKTESTTTTSVTTAESTVLNYSTTPFMAVNTATGQTTLIAILIPSVVGGVVVLAPLIGCVYILYKKIGNKVSTSIREC